MLSKFIFFIFSSMIAIAAQSKEIITIVYAWGPGDSVANYSRSLVAEANKSQDKYKFLFDTKPGAGGAIASNHVLNTPNTILHHSTAFFVRPNFYPNESYDLTKFRTIMTKCMAPMAITSSKYKNWKEVPTDKPITVGVSGLGVTTHLAAVQLQKKYPNVNIIPFKATSESLVSMVSTNTDFHIGFISEAENWSKENSKNIRKVNLLGITGTKKVNGYSTLGEQGLGSVFNQMDVGFHFLMPASTPDVQVKEIREIFLKAQKTEAVKAAYDIDYCQTLTVDYSGLDNWYKFHTAHWKKLSEGIVLK